MRFMKVEILKKLADKLEDPELTALDKYALTGATQVFNDTCVDFLDHGFPDTFQAIQPKLLPEDADLHMGLDGDTCYLYVGSIACLNKFHPAPKPS